MRSELCGSSQASSDGRRLPLGHGVSAAAAAAVAVTIRSVGQSAAVAGTDQLAVGVRVQPLTRDLAPGDLRHLQALVRTDEAIAARVSTVDIILVTRLIQQLAAFQAELHLFVFLLRLTCEERKEHAGDYTFGFDTRIYILSKLSVIPLSIFYSNTADKHKYFVNY